MFGEEHLSNLRAYSTTEEHRNSLSRASRGVPKTESHREAMSESRVGRYRGADLEPRRQDPDGYIVLSKLEHPLSGESPLYEHRVVLYNELGPGPHPCHWCSVTLEWGGRTGIHVDHLNWNKSDNRPSNLVPSCLVCNIRRHEMKVE